MTQNTDDFYHVPHSEIGLTANSVAEICQWRGENQPDMVAYRFLHNGLDEYEELTYAELLLRMRVISASFSPVSEGLEADRALLVFPSGLDYITSFYACLYGGVTAVPAYPMLSHSDSIRLRVIINDCKPRYILTNSALKDRLLSWLKQENLSPDAFDIIVVDELGIYAGQSHSIDTQKIAFLQYTSGSTGNPKGVIVPNRNLVHNSGVIYRKFGHTPNSEVVSWLPPFHDMGLVGGIIQPLFGGFTSNIMSPMTFLRRPMRWLQAISRYGATSSGGPNFSYKLCLKHHNEKQMKDVDLSSWQVAFNGAEPIQSQTLKDFAAVFSRYGFKKETMYPCYGLAEATLFISGCDSGRAYKTVNVDKTALQSHQVILTEPGHESRELVSTGDVLENQVLIVDPSSQKVLGEKQIGEIWLAGESIADGYWKKPVETEDIFQAYTSDGKGPFARTGDYGFFDGKELFVTGRLKELIIVNGKNYFPSDIENTVQSVSPALRADSGAAISIDQDSEQLIIVQEIERSWQRKVELQELKEQIVAQCFEQHAIRPGEVVIVEQSTIPKTTSGKVKRLQVKNNYLQGSYSSL
ncbi:hypothetical protein PRUB_b0263 [Pseudoalteromonas rubra]|uniref:AMP-dependent synthetase/ligase domain-containing protein n=1 Tax=Pseudoalteromonas rubra TaxID=43658 RepID=A0A8T0C1L5_9GAMM|nr:fatty acyl-AMP ligase [Pseudoalteromonas rubra]KAF7781138.1 hypothetical protein PRUB_b0263 [Pseudoalteromonas rubra]